ncbi:3-isopropylmalate dehydratase small subunit [Croceicoccus naphthovorans]|uniref:3-isopropylmalate dehydratase small subunit n=1 Tax=Croceicoccus naphthovorans TaxID=1348774 RepID=A0A0G3XFN7_9SPHN|nr:3-isopropylmalate dehydratase small subunit [Croceicoccus naphthovorans]AKM09429.1 3-isopropylmalate dehydratase [Croceicoccus naphthovorans]MBB3992245.1 3-isopropylmalate/(R)-2-methylmalate dehydratase small subunit [Croceicoccus naphthovorans]
MEPIGKIEGRAIPFGANNVDTDAIIPARWLKTITREGLGAGAFEMIRRNPNNIFDSEAYSGAPILIAGGNFGCGSSREHAAWALLGMGLKAVIAPSFSDIFSSNAFKNGLLTIVLPQNEVDRLLEVAGNGNIAIDLEKQTITTSCEEGFKFEIDPFRKHSLLEGLDETGLTMTHCKAITRYELRGASTHSFLYRPHVG